MSYDWELENRKRNQHDKKKIAPAKPLVRIFEELDLTWFEEELETAIKLYNDGFNIIDMALLLRPALGPTNGQWEVTLMLQYLIFTGKITKRRSGVLGNVC